jgi:orotidine-5'-phosphate decarboxylase
MGHDTVDSYLKFPGKWVILLALTSSSGSKDFQYIETRDGFLYETVIKKANTWAGPDQMMFVVGATRSNEFINVRNHAPDNFLLVPGVGAQGGDLGEVCKYGMTKDCGLIVNASRSIIYASQGDDFAEAARAEALKIQQQMEIELEKAGII